MILGGSVAGVVYSGAFACPLHSLPNFIFIEYFYTSLVRPPFNCTSFYQRTTGDASTAQLLKGSLQLESATAYNPNSRPHKVQYGGVNSGSYIGQDGRNNE